MGQDAESHHEPEEEERPGVGHEGADDLREEQEGAKDLGRSESAQSRSWNMRYVDDVDEGKKDIVLERLTYLKSSLSRSTLQSCLP